MESSSHFFVIFLSLTGLIIIVPTEAQTVPTYVYHDCSNTTTFTSNSTYQANLKILLSTLSSNGNTSNGFYNSSAGQDPDDVYGLYLCRGDVSTDVCQQCIAFATKDVVQRCPVEKVAVIWYDQCFLRYSNRPVSPVLDATGYNTLVLINSQNITGNQQQFVDLVTSTMSEITAVAAAGTLLPGKKFAVKDVNFTSIQRLYALAQCTPDLSTSDCKQCLVPLAGQLAITSQGAQTFNPSCSARYEIYPFYNTSVVPSSPLPPPVIRSPPPPSPGSVPRRKGSNHTTIIVVAIVVPICVSFVLLCIGYCFLLRRAKKKNDFMQGDNDGNDITTVESLQFDFSTIETATQNFADTNKLGEGGFGAVYKGILPNGQEIAVKRLSRNSGQGIEEFKNEVILVAKLQHRNLVRLLGFCLEGVEKILVYEFVSNKSLDYSLFDPEKRGQLDWSKRYKIIGGIARGILYLHQDSRLRIIHRDLKTSNILLDTDMNAKISDFGMARIFGVDQTQGNTSRIVGTYGYMSPEYAMRGHFSVKSDVYSFGVLILEIICGQRNSSFYQTEGAEDLVSNVWEHWREGTPMNVLDPTLGDKYSRNEVIRCIHIGLLCVQEDPSDRPTMEAVILMLNSYSVTLALPQQPAFFTHSRSDQSSSWMKGVESDESRTKSVSLSVDKASITEVYPR